ncbi:glucuronate isomerase [Enterococcus sp. PF1-24]|uniref:glucuronate isomerase n=1 Tax=unclassified Enterococcus TaxID=2608891 RepID=UPI00247489D0|nr:MULTISPECIES: glucuronate isomerase [unclassified Enterococcus]MDH6363986.1 glucuronate isomerase [Enterococcus sp. PFB1-1]MDH6401087.1 glucuronate isomerase [Enterococcus sp. PF1-24]
MFLDKDFVLKNDFAKTLYHDYAENMPIIDYHCHLDPKEIYDDLKFENITQAWLGGDHYKWRLMRANGVAETLITGDGSDYDKFLAWAQTMEGCIGNPLYVWTHLELRRIFGIEDLLNEKNAPKIWEQANRKLQEESFSVRNLIEQFKVKIICTTDDPSDSLTYHQKLLKEEKRFKVYPTFRPDKAVAIQTEGYLDYLLQLGTNSGEKITSYKTLVQALSKRVDYFHELGGRLSDHSFPAFTAYQEIEETKLAKIFEKRMAGESLTEAEISYFQFGLALDLMRLYAKKGWTAQLHLMATRNNNSKIFNSYGPDGGGDAMGDDAVEAGISRLFDLLNSEENLPKTILYSLNAKDYLPLVALMGAFQADVKGKIQFGSAWWFNDSYSGMRHQMTTLAEGGILANFVGMLTDSRSFLSYPRHEYFRRILCQLISEWVEDGQLPADSDYIGEIIEKISYTNANQYFGFN